MIPSGNLWGDFSKKHQQDFHEIIRLSFENLGKQELLIGSNVKPTGIDLVIFGAT